MSQIAVFATVLALTSGTSVEARTPAETVRKFISDVRSARNPDLASEYMAAEVRAHQLAAEGVTTIVRTPDNYAQHVRDFRRLFGDFRVQVEELISDGDKVFVRWRQEGCHCGSLAGETPTGKPLIEITSVVYRIEGSRIVEYWLQTDRKGLEVQLER